MTRMIDEIVTCLGMDEHIQAFAAQHEPRNDLIEVLDVERDLIHRLRVRADRPVMPSSQSHFESAQPIANALRALARRTVVIDVRVIAGDIGDRFHRK